MTPLGWLGRKTSTQTSISDCRSRGRKFKSKLGHITVMESDHEIISTVILPFAHIQEGQLIVTGENICTNTGKLLRKLKHTQEKCEYVNWTAWHDFNIVYWAAKLKLKQTYTCPNFWTSPFNNRLTCLRNSADPDQMPHSVASDLGLHCLLRPVCPSVLI